MALIALVVSVIALITVLRLLDVERRAASAILVTHEALGVFSDPDLSDDDKERHIRRATVTLMKTSFALLAIAAVAFFAAAVIVVGGDFLGLFQISEALDIAFSWSFILWSTVGSVVLWLLLGRFRSDKSSEPRESVPYSGLDKALHNKAFASPGLQKKLSRIEDKLWKRQIEATHTERPVLITSLPRAGTTILLELLAKQPEFASATYRNMPFTLSPLLWRKISGVFFKAHEKTERAHGDGIAVNLDSPEAFEEMIWMAFWQEHYEGRKIKLWDRNDRNAEFEEFLTRHMRKIVASQPDAVRYVSKNNANIARLPLLSTAFPEARLVIPVRDPASHVASLMRQHQRFTDLHSRDRFARQYMEGVGHFEFGEALRPIDFPGSPDDVADAITYDYWLRYWNAAYRHVLKNAPDESVFVDPRALSARPEDELPKLADALGLKDKQGLVSAADIFQPQKPPPILTGASAQLMDEANDLHIELLKRAL